MLSQPDLEREWLRKPAMALQPFYGRSLILMERLGEDIDQVNWLAFLDQLDLEYVVPLFQA